MSCKKGTMRCMWLRRDAWLRLIQPLVANVPMLATIGERFITSTHN